MDQKKSKHPIIANVIHYLFVAIVIGLLVVALIFEKQMEELFAKNVFVYEGLNNVWHYLPHVVHVIEILGLMFVLIFVVNLFVKLNLGLTYKSKTMIKVSLSILKWIIIVGGLIWMLYALGVDAAALLISAGVISLVIGLAAQNLISDCIAGMFIVIEGKFLIDDIVVIDGYRGKVKNISLRTTSIEDIGGNVKSSITARSKHL